MASNATRKSTSEPSLEDLTEQMAILRDDIAALTSTVGNFGKAKADEAAETVKSTAADLKEAGQQSLAETQARAEDFIRSQPATALGLAAGVGFLVGLLTARR